MTDVAYPDGITPEVVVKELRRALAVLMCKAHTADPKPCESCLREVEPLTKPIVKMLLLAAGYRTGIEGQPADQPKVYQRVGRAIENCLIDAFGHSPYRASITVKYTKDPIQWESAFK